MPNDRNPFGKGEWFTAFESKVHEATFEEFLDEIFTAVMGATELVGDHNIAAVDLATNRTLTRLVEPLKAGLDWCDLRHVGKLESDDLARLLITNLEELGHCPSNSFTQRFESFPDVDFGLAATAEQ